jgi:hypothetical protein
MHHSVEQVYGRGMPAARRLFQHLSAPLQPAVLCPCARSPLYCDSQHPQDLERSTVWGIITAPLDAPYTGQWGLADGASAACLAASGCGGLFCVGKAFLSCWRVREELVPPFSSPFVKGLPSPITGATTGCHEAACGHLPASVRVKVPVT